MILYKLAILRFFLQLEFDIRRVQMNFLHLLSSGAEQRVTIHCFNTSIWSATPGQSAPHNAVGFRAWTGEMLQPDVLEDTCWVRATEDMMVYPVLVMRYVFGYLRLIFLLSTATDAGRKPSSSFM